MSDLRIQAWQALAVIIRGDLPVYLDALGFRAQADRLRGLGDLGAGDGEQTAAELRRISRELCGEIFDENVRLATIPPTLDDELDRIKARRAVQDQRFKRAPLMIRLALDVCGGMVAQIGYPRAGERLTTEQQYRIAMREIEDVRRSLERP